MLNMCVAVTNAAGPPITKSAHKKLRHDFSRFPNYLYINFLNLLVPVIVAALCSGVYYLRNAPLRKTVSSEVRNLCRNLLDF
jgi:hypothetical protein